MKHAYLTPLTASFFLPHIDSDNVLANTVSTTNSTSRGGEDSSHANAVFVLQSLLSVVTKLTKRGISEGCCLQNIVSQRFLQHTVLFKAVNPWICGDLRACLFHYFLQFYLFLFFLFQAINMRVNLPALQIPNSLSLTYWKDGWGKKQFAVCFGEQKTVNWNQEKGNEAMCTAHHSSL